MAASEPVQHIVWTQEVYGTNIPVIDEEHQVERENPPLLLTSFFSFLFIIFILF